MRLFDHFPKEKVSLVKKDGRRFDLDALVQAKMIFSEDPSIPIEDGDEFHRVLPSGVAETYIVIDAGYKPAFHGMPAHYQSQVRKSTAPAGSHSGNVYNLHGANSRVNIHSVDSSTNTSSANAPVFVDIRNAIQQAHLNDALAQRLLERVDAMQSSAGTQGFGQAYRDFIAMAADHMSLFAPFVPALSQFLV